MFYDGTMEVDAKSKTEAMDIAREKLADDINCVNWNFSDATPDYAEVE